MGNLGEIWEFWRPLVLGGIAIALLALFTVGYVSHQKSEQEAYLQALKESGPPLKVKNEVDEYRAINDARAQALATLDRVKDSTQ